MRRFSVSDSVLRRLRSVPREAFFWGAALLGVACMDPQDGLPVNLCLIEQLGLPCPGNGLGAAIAHLARGQWAASWAAHPLGAPVVGILLYHVGTLCRRAPRRVSAPAVSSR
jgi:hypothetical protein